MQRPSTNSEQVLGERLRARRQTLGLTLRQLAGRAQVSASMISGVEHGTKSPSISVLVALAEALGTSLSQLVDGGEPRKGSLLRLTKADQRIVTDPSGVSREHFEPSIEGSRLEFVRFVLPPGSSTNELAPHAPGSLEHAHVSYGNVEISAGTERIVASEGDTVVFNADQSHGYRNSGRSEAAVYVVVEPRSLPTG